MKQNRFIGYFIADQQSDFYQSPAFTNVLKAVQNNPGKLKMKEKKTRAGLRLLLTSENVRDVNRAYEILRVVVA